MARINVGSADRMLRIVVGIGLVFAGSMNPWGWLGFVPLATGLTGICPLYNLLGIRTCKAE